MTDMTRENPHDSADRSGAENAADSGGSRTRLATRRGLLAATGTVGIGSLAGCFGLLDSGDDDDDGNTTGNGTDVDIANFRGSGPLVEARGEPGGTSIADLPALEGDLSFFLGGGEGGLYLDLIELFTDIYPDFSYTETLGSSRQLSNRIVTEVEAGQPQADVFMAVDAGSIANVASQGATVSLPSEVTSTVDSDFRTDQWVGFAGRARAIPYNSSELSESDVPDSVLQFPETAALEGNIGWAPSYSAFQGFVTAMRLNSGEETARQWLNDMQDHGVETYDNEFLVSNSVANGSILTGFANHYYALRVKNARPNASVDLTFTSGDAGALINVSGAEIIKGTNKQELAENFIRHLLSAEAQEFFATRTFAYPTVPDVAPAGGLPTIDELNPPDIDLQKLSDTEPTVELLEETGAL